MSTLAASPLLPVITAAQADFLIRDHKVPVDGYGPARFFIYCFSGESAMATDAEIAILKNYCEFVCQIYNETARERILNAPLPVCGGHNTVEFFKGPTASVATPGWSYRRNSWRTGTVPFYNQEPPPPWTLLQVIDHIERVDSGGGAKWLAWKESHPKVFSIAE